MNWEISATERTYLRELARKQADYAALPVMAERRQMWYALNDAQTGARPPVIIETATFDRDFLPDSVFRCESRTARSIEKALLRHTRNHELINDDKVVPNYYPMGWWVEIDELGVRIPRVTVKDAEGVETGYQFIHPIKDLERDFHLLKPAVCRVDREKTTAWKAFLTDLLGDLLPVRIETGTFGCNMLTQRVVHLMGMEAYFQAMYDQPEAVHRLMAYLRDNSLRVMKWAETEGLLRVNNGNQASFGSSYNFTRRLPAPSGLQPPAAVQGKTPLQPEAAAPHARLRDMWGNANSQETVGVSPRMFHEFCAPYYSAVCEPLGLIYYGCCEPAHPFWDDIIRLPHLKKVSISRWCDERFVAERLRGTDIVYSRKPDPNFLSVAQRLDEESWAKHIRATLEATKGCFVEFIVRDVYTVHGYLENARRAVQVARREIDRFA